MNGDFDRRLVLNRLRFIRLEAMDFLRLYCMNTNQEEVAFILSSS